MAVSKSELFDEQEIQLAELAKALSHPARIKILKILLDKNVCMCGDIVELLPLAQSTVSQHLKELKGVGLIAGEIEGPRICYCLNMKMIQKAKDYFNRLLATICSC
jgi:DNA-binding transcriptional ArsR family regulator